MALSGKQRDARAVWRRYAYYIFGKSSGDGSHVKFAQFACLRVSRIFRIAFCFPPNLGDINIGRYAGFATGVISEGGLVGEALLRVAIPDGRSRPMRYRFDIHLLDSINDGSPLVDPKPGRTIPLK